MKTNREVDELRNQGRGKALIDQHKHLAQEALRKAAGDYVETLEQIGTPLGCDPVMDLFDSNMTFPLCDFQLGEPWELSVVPLAMAEARRPAEKSKMIAAWKEGAVETVEGWDRMFQMDRSWTREESLMTLVRSARALLPGRDARDRKFTHAFLSGDGQKYEILIRPVE